MGYGIIRLQKIHHGNVATLGTHIMRTRKSYSNPDIDPKKTAQNEVLWGDTANLASKVDSYIKDKLRERQVRTGYRMPSTEIQLPKDGKPHVLYDDPVRIKADAVRLVECVITASPDDIKSWSRQKQDEYFQRALLFMARCYGEGNIMYAVVHRDEATPHMHLGFVPITRDGRLCAKELVNRNTLRNLQDEYHAQVSSFYGLSRGGDKEIKEKHRSGKEYKAYAEVLKGLKAEEATVQKSLSEKKKAYLDLEAKIQALQPVDVDRSMKIIKAGHEAVDEWKVLGKTLAEPYHRLNETAWQEVKKVQDTILDLHTRLQKQEAATARAKDKTTKELEKELSLLDDLDIAHQRLLFCKPYIDATEDERAELQTKVQARKRKEEELRVKKERQREQQAAIEAEKRRKEKSRGWSR